MVEPDAHQPGCSRQGWQHEVSVRLEEEFLESLFPDMVPSRQALPRSQSGPGAGAAFSVTPSSARIESPLFRVLLEGRLYHCPIASADVAVPPTLLATIAQLAGGRGCWEKGVPTRKYGSAHLQGSWRPCGAEHAGPEHGLGCAWSSQEAEARRHCRGNGWSLLGRDADVAPTLATSWNASRKMENPSVLVWKRSGIPELGPQSRVRQHFGDNGVENVLSSLELELTMLEFGEKQLAADGRHVVPRIHDTQRPTVPSSVRDLEAVEKHPRSVVSSVLDQSTVMDSTQRMMPMV